MPRRFHCIALVVPAFLALLPSLARGQGSLAGDDRGFISFVKPSNFDLDRLKDFKAGKLSIEGSTQSEAVKNQEILDKAAKYYVFQLTDPQVIKTTGYGSPGAKVDELFRNVLEPSDPKRYDPDKPMTAEQQRYMSKFAALLAANVKIVLHNKEPIARVNAARIVARLAECGQQNVSDLLVETLDDPKQIDAVKIFAL